MFAKWFGTRSHRRSIAQGNRFRPQLECLEGRLAPSSMGGMQGESNNDGGDNNGGQHSGMQAEGNNGGDDKGGGDDNGGQHNNVHINNHDNYHVNEHNSFNVVFDTITVNQTISTLGTPVNQLEQQLFSVLGQALMTTPGATIGDAISLVTTEFQLGQDVGQLVNGILSGAGTNQNLLNTISQLETSIQNNPLEVSAAGSVAGSLAFNIALQTSLPQLTGQQGH